MNEVSLLIGGKAGFGIDKAGLIIGRLFNRLGYRVYICRDYPSIIRGGHTFSIIRASGKRIYTHREKIDFLLALNQDTFSQHKHRLKDNALVIYDSDSVKLDGLSAGVKSAALALGKILKEENAPEIMRNTCLIGSLSKSIGLPFENLETILKKEIPRDIELNLKVALRGYDSSGELFKIERIEREILPLMTANEALGLGLVNAGLDAYVAYPMTPSSPILHYLAELAQGLRLKVIHPESEIAVILMALGFAYAGKKAAVGTSGGGFCLMTEGLSFAGMAELPVVIILGQRPGPSTGLPTYSGQSELHFAINSGQGEFSRFITAPGDAEEAYVCASRALNIAWKHQIPSIILTDKNLGEGAFNFDKDLLGGISEETALLWDGKSPYKRYLNTETGVSPLAFAPEKDAVIKINSYEHDENGITTEEIGQVVSMQDKRLRKEKYLAEEINGFEAVKVYGEKNAKTALLCWGSNKGVCREAADELRLKLIQPVVLWPFPVEQFKSALSGVERLICVENNAAAELARLINGFGFKVDEKILKFDGRPFSLDELIGRIKL